MSRYAQWYFLSFGLFLKLIFAIDFLFLLASKCKKYYIIEFLEFLEIKGFPLISLINPHLSVSRSYRVGIE